MTCPGPAKIVPSLKLETEPVTSEEPAARLKVPPLLVAPAPRIVCPPLRLTVPELVRAAVRMRKVGAVMLSVPVLLKAVLPLCVTVLSKPLMA